MDTDFAVGDVVKLKSGGHDMTVQGLEKDNGDLIKKPEGDFRVRAAWMDETGKLHVSHGLSPAMLESVSKVERKEPEPDPLEAEQRAIAKGRGNAENNSPSGLNRPKSPVVQSDDPDSVHHGDDFPQSLGNEAERQPAQEPEIAHTRLTDDKNDDRGTVHEVGRDYQPSGKLKDAR